jgi:hypothetical protein
MKLNFHYFETLLSGKNIFTIEILSLPDCVIQAGLHFIPSDHPILLGIMS